MAVEEMLPEDIKWKKPVILSLCGISKCCSLGGSAKSSSSPPGRVWGREGAFVGKLSFYKRPPGEGESANNAPVSTCSKLPGRKGELCTAFEGNSLINGWPSCMAIK